MNRPLPTAESVLRPGLRKLMSGKNETTVTRFEFACAFQSHRGVTTWAMMYAAANMEGLSIEHSSDTVSVRRSGQ